MSGHGLDARSGPRGALRRPADLARETPRRFTSDRGGEPEPPGGSGDWSGEPDFGRPTGGWPEGFAAGPTDRAALLVLLSLASLTPRRLMDLSRTLPTATACLQAVRGGRGCSERDRSLALALEGADIARRVQEAGCRFVAQGDAEYPEGLSDLFDPPAGLFVRGRPLHELGRRVSIVGARNCSAGGQEVAGALARGLAGAAVCVVSGGARGIDAAAHRGALAAGGRTVAVLGCGIDVAYPRENSGLLASIVESGAVVSEYPPGTPAEPFRFPARNRIIAALAEGVVVVEGAAGSGSLITAEHALDIGREVFAVPGSPLSELAVAPLELIREGAGVIRGPTDLLGDLHIVASPTGLRDHGPSVVVRPAGLSDRQGSVWEALSDPAPPDRLSARTGLTLPEVLSALGALEMRGLVSQAGGRFQRRLLL
jgi:DNA processing protein